MLESVVKQDQQKTDEAVDRSMTHITEHHSKEEWEGRHCQQSWVSFKVVGSTISVNNLLESEGEFVEWNVGWWNNLVIVEEDNFNC